MRELDRLFPRVLPGRRSGPAQSNAQPEARIVDLEDNVSGPILQIKQHLLQLLSVITYQDIDVGDQVRACGGVELVLSLTEFDESNPRKWSSHLNCFFPSYNYFWFPPPGDHSGHWLLADPTPSTPRASALCGSKPTPEQSRQSSHHLQDGSSGHYIRRNGGDTSPSGQDAQDEPGDREWRCRRGRDRQRQPLVIICNTASLVDMQCPHLYRTAHYISVSTYMYSLARSAIRLLGYNSRKHTVQLLH